MSTPNFLILCSDEHARSAAGCYGSDIVKTPALDGLAARGTLFSRAYTPSPICIPARACLATGTQVFQNRCWSSAEPYYGQVESWMHRLQGAGRRVASVGKLHFRSGEDDNGFDEEIEPMYLANEGRGWPQGLLRQPMPDYPEARELAEESGPGESTYTAYDRRITEAATNWIGEAGSDPWTLFVSWVSPHYPLTCPEEFFALYDGAEIPEPYAYAPEDRPRHPVLQEMVKFWSYDDYFDAETMKLARRCYYGLCSFLDDQVAKVLAALEASGEADNTVVVYISDHGEMLGNHGFWTKSVMFEDSVAIPMIMAGPGIPEGVNDTLVSLTDIGPTAEQLAGLDADGEGWQARPLTSIIKTPDPDRVVLSEYHDGGSPTGAFMVCWRMWKYVAYAGGHPPQLFDLSSDPDEMNDLGQDPGHAEVRARMQARLEAILDPEAVNAQAFADQAVLLDQYGGADAVRAMPSFNHTPVGT